MPTKPFYLSKTFWGALLMLIALGIRTAGVEITPDDQDQAADTIVAAIEAMVGLAGFFITLWGRATAKKGLTLTVLLGLMMVLPACATIPAHLVDEHLAAVEPHHMALVREHRPQDEATWAEHYKSMHDLVDAAEGR